MARNSMALPILNPLTCFMRRALLGHISIGRFGEKIRVLPSVHGVTISGILRTKFGKDYADQLAAYTVRTLIDNPEEGMDADRSVYLCRHLRTAFGVVDNGAKKWPEIVAALANPKLQNACPVN
jgi:hypothetical protein